MHEMLYYSLEVRGYSNTEQKKIDNSDPLILRSGFF